ncbi:ABC transporter ATP-binding protein [Alkalihalobacillus pseudalcaliphilus]|uniref:ABC transporter ATP-binding protein n=1 Tax=Alkalihalobacillus pseudalcaliphilus TaxID=79884 RepID=UPI00064DCC64|nr:ABC transporter ATP-binding protein [Alkalihalobacillus pseudalcaliphilus]KMK76125.1 spermidine/putrescine ABC transporter ATP-binding protein [Alkalihalobacillus pseudalcaliphilus]
MIQLKQVTKKYGLKTALKDIDLHLEKGKIIGLIGENGSGKSTTLKLIAGLTSPSSGTVHVFEQPVSRRIASHVSFLSDEDMFYSYMTVKDVLDFYQGQFNDFNRSKAEDMLVFMELTLTDKVKKLSKGNRGRLKIVLALSRDVPIVVMDEPLSGLDPLVRDSIMKSLVSFVDLEKQLILITTHEIKEFEMILDEVILIKNGQIIGHESVDTIREQEGTDIVGWMKKRYVE